MTISEQIERNISVNIATCIPRHLYMRVRKKAREQGISKSKLLREILADHFNYDCKQYRSRGQKIYLYRKEN